MSIKHLFLTLSVAACLTSSALAQVVVFTDTFSSGTPADAGYYRFGTTGTTLAESDPAGNLNYTYSSTAANRSGVYKTFSEQTLANTGDFITFSFAIDSRTLRASENHAFRWAIGNLGNPTAISGLGSGETLGSTDLASATPLGGGTRQMYQFSASTGTTAGFGQFTTGSTSFTHNAGSDGTASSITSTGPASIATTGSSNVSLTITRTETGFSFAQTAFGIDSTGTFTGGTNIFNTLAFSFNNAGDYNLALSDVSVSVIPEPGILGLLSMGFFSMWAMRRRRQA